MIFLPILSYLLCNFSLNEWIWMLTSEGNLTSHENTKSWQMQMFKSILKISLYISINWLLWVFQNTSQFKTELTMPSMHALSLSLVFLLTESLPHCCVFFVHLSLSLHLVIFLMHWSWSFVHVFPQYGILLSFYVAFLYLWREPAILWNTSRVSAIPFWAVNCPTFSLFSEL